MKFRILSVNNEHLPRCFFLTNSECSFWQCRGSGSGRIGIIVADPNPDRHPGPDDPDPDLYPFFY
jgi:hypothetical protein